MLSRRLIPRHCPIEFARSFCMCWTIGAAGAMAQAQQSATREEIPVPALQVTTRLVQANVVELIRLQWKDVHFGRGNNGEVEILTQERSKLAIIPLSTELRENLGDIRRER